MLYVKYFRDVIFTYVVPLNPIKRIASEYKNGEHLNAKIKAPVPFEASSHLKIGNPVMNRTREIGEIFGFYMIPYRLPNRGFRNLCKCNKSKVKLVCYHNYAIPCLIVCYSAQVRSCELPSPVVLDVILVSFYLIWKKKF